MAGEMPECRNSQWKEKPWACSPGDSRIHLGALLLAAEGIAMELGRVINPWASLEEEEY